MEYKIQLHWPFLSLLKTEKKVDVRLNIFSRHRLEISSSQHRQENKWQVMHSATIQLGAF